MTQDSLSFAFLRDLTRSLAKVKDTFAAVRVGAFRIFFFGQLTSSIGDWMQLTAANALVLELHGGGIGLGVVNVAMLLPRVLLSPYAGILADRHAKHRILLMCNALLLIDSAIIGILLGRHSLDLATLYSLTFANGALDAFNLPARQAFIAEIVPRRQLINASALYATALTLSRALGPIAAGLLISVIDVSSVFYANSTSYLLLLIALARLRGVEPTRTAAAALAPSRPWRRFRASWSVVGCRTPLLLSGIVGGFGITSPVLLPVFAEQSLRSSAFAYTVLFGVVGTGTLVGSLLTAARNVASDRPALIASFMLASTLLLICSAPTVAVAIVPLFISGVAGAVSLTTAFARLQALAEDRNRGAIMGMYSFISIGSSAFAMPIMGYIAQISNPRIGYAVCGTAVMLGSALVLPARRRWAISASNCPSWTPGRSPVQHETRSD